jgi:hypothetical protein
MFCQKEGWRCIVEDITLLQFSIAYGSRASSMRTTNSVGSADQGMMHDVATAKPEECDSPECYLILSYRHGDRGPGGPAARWLRAGGLAH